MAGNGLERHAGNEVVLCPENPAPTNASSDNKCHPVTHEGIDQAAFVYVTDFTMFYKVLIIRRLSAAEFSWHGQCLTKSRL